MTRDPDSPYYTRSEAAHYCRVSLKTIDRWTASGRLARCSDGPPRYHRAALDFALKHNTPGGSAGNLMEPQPNPLGAFKGVRHHYEPDIPDVLAALATSPFAAPEGAQFFHAKSKVARWHSYSEEWWGDAPF